MSYRIVVIEDELILLEALRTALSREDMEPIAASTGQEGIDTVKSELPDLVLLDILLPEKDGFEVLQELKNDPTTKDIPVIILSNLSQDEDLRKAIELGAEDYYVKASTDLANLVQKIKNMLGEKTGSSEPDSESGDKKSQESAGATFS